MRKGKIIVYYGGGKGKTCVAVGRGLRAIGDGLRVVMIQFMDYYNSREMSLLKKLDYKERDEDHGDDLELLFLMCMEEYPEAKQMRPGRR